MEKEKEIKKQLEMLVTQQTVVDDKILKLMLEDNIDDELRKSLAKLSSITIYLHNLIQDELRGNCFEYIIQEINNTKKYIIKEKEIMKGENI